MTSIAWKFFTPKPDEPIIAVCNICNDRIRRGKEGSERGEWSTGTLLGHLDSHHKSELIQKRKELEPALAAEKAKKGDHQTPGELKNRMQQANIKNLFPNKQPYKPTDVRQKMGNQKLLQMIVMDNQPFSICEDPGFIGYSACLNPQYTIPSRKTISELLDPEFERVRQLIQLEVNKAPYVSFTSDMWTEDTTKAAFLSLSGKV